MPFNQYWQGLTACFLLTASNGSKYAGEGTRFHICLPGIDAPAAKEPEQAEAAVSQGAGETILVIDDEAFLREFVEAMLTTNGYRVIAAASGEEGLELYRRCKSEIQLVILDLLMPGMGGRQCLASSWRSTRRPGSLSQAVRASVSLKEIRCSTAPAAIFRSPMM